MAIKFTVKDTPAAAKPGTGPAKPPAAEQNAADPAAEAELFPAAAKEPTKKRKRK